MTLTRSVLKARLILAALLLFVAVWVPQAPEASSAARSPADDMIPLIDMPVGATYAGFSGGLYPDGSSNPPPQHATAGLAQAVDVQPRDVNGSLDPGGKIVFLSIGMSNATQEFCSHESPDGVTCNSWTFMGRAAADPEVNHDSLVLVNGAAGGQDAAEWDSAADANYDRVGDMLIALGLSEAQVQVVWVKVANAYPSAPALPDPAADAYTLLTLLGNINRSLKLRYPNLRQVYVSSRIYGGYATTPLNPEPYAYESGFSVKWLVEAQIDQMESGGTLVHPVAGDLNYTTVAAWVAWGPYLWAAGATPRSDGLTWLAANLEADGTHPSTSGEQKAGNELLDFFKTAPHSQCWFLAGQACGGIYDEYLPLVHSG